MNGNDIVDLDPEDIDEEKLPKVTFQLMRDLYKLEKENKDKIDENKKVAKSNEKSIKWLISIYTFIMLLLTSGIIKALFFNGG